MASSPFAFDATALAGGVAVGLVALLLLVIFCMRHRRRPGAPTAHPSSGRLEMQRTCSFRNACPAAACPMRRHPLSRLAGKLPCPPRTRMPTTELPDASSDEELPIMKQHPEEEDGGGAGARGDGGEDAAAEDDAPAGSGSLGPQPLPAPAVLDQRNPAPLPHYSHLELRRLEGDGDTSHCWAGLPGRHVAVRAASYLVDGTKAVSEPASLCLAVELFRAAAPVFDVAGSA